MRTITAEKITILYLLDTLIEMAGSERNLFEVVTRVNPEKYAPVVACMRGGAMVTLLREQGIEVMNLHLKRIYSPRALEAALRLFRVIRERRVKILVTYHNSSDYFGLLIGKLAGVPVIISNRRDMGYRYKKRHLFIYRCIDNWFDRIITVSDAVKRVVSEKEHALWNKLVTIHNGVEATSGRPKTEAIALRKFFNIPEGEAVIGIVAVVRPIKGHQYFLEASALVLKEFPGARMLVVGWPEDRRYYEWVKEQAHRLGIAKSVIFTGGLTNVPAIMSILDVSVISSINEGFSNAVIESMAAGKPVVATNTGGTPEAVVDGETGILVPPGDPKALAGAILRLLRNKELAGEMGKRARKRAEKLFSMGAMIKKIELLYGDLLREKSETKASPQSPGFPRLARMARRAIKGWISSVIYYSGLVRMFTRGARARGSVKILAYHRITNECFMLPGMGIKVENFERHLYYIQRYYHPLSMERVLQLMDAGGPIPENAIVITFDDGYKDNYSVAFPILERYGIPATIFLSVRAIEQKGLLWFDVLTRAFKETRAVSIDLSDYGLKKYTLDSFHARLRTANEAVSFAKRFKNAQREDFIDGVTRKLGIAPGRSGGRDTMMSWQDVIRMKGRGMSFGSHGMSHTILSRLSEEELEYEIGMSKRIIKEKTGIDVKLFAYPNGQKSDLSDAAERILRKYDYSTACTLIKGSNSPVSNRMQLRRVCVTEGMESNAFGQFSKALFAVMITKSLHREGPFACNRPLPGDARREDAWSR